MAPLLSGAQHRRAVAPVVLLSHRCYSPPGLSQAFMLSVLSGAWNLSTGAYFLSNLDISQHQSKKSNQSWSHAFPLSYIFHSCFRKLCSIKWNNYSQFILSHSWHCPWWGKRWQYVVSLCVLNRNSKYVELIGSGCFMKAFNWKSNILRNKLFIDLNIQLKIQIFFKIV